MKALLRDAMPDLYTVSAPIMEGEKLATKVDVAAKGLTVAGKVCGTLQEAGFHASRQVVSFRHKAGHKMSSGLSL